MTSHQICQMRENPVTTANTAVMNPVGLLLGISMDEYCGSDAPASPARACCLPDQCGSSPVTLGKFAKLNTGGGEEVDHSRERASQTSPVVSRRVALPRIEIHNCAI